MAATIENGLPREQANGWRSTVVRSAGEYRIPESAEMPDFEGFNTIPYWVIKLHDPFRSPRSVDQNAFCKVISPPFGSFTPTWPNCVLVYKFKPLNTFKRTLYILNKPSSNLNVNYEKPIFNYLSETDTALAFKLRLSSTSLGLFGLYQLLYVKSKHPVGIEIYHVSHSSIRFRTFQTSRKQIGNTDLYHSNPRCV